MTSPIWHPFTQHALFPKMTEIVRTDGAYLYTADGRKLFDGVASWWVITHGHRYSPIAEAIRQETERLDQVIFAGFTHPPAEELGQRLVDLAPAGLDYVFFSDSGSTAVEVGIKMALGYWAYHNPKRQRVIVMEHSYHGDTIGGMSVGERGVYNAAYEPLLFDVARVPFPEGDGQNTLSALEELCQSPDIAALVVEPLILGAGGMFMYSPDILAKMHAITNANDVLFVADEVMTGWGRTGTLWACDQAKFSPDILCTAKGITGGLIPLAATLAHQKIYDAHYSEDRRRTFYHSSSYTANPIACAAALANLDVWQQEPVMERIEHLSLKQETRLNALAEDSRFANPRRHGTITAIDLVVEDAGYLATLGPDLQRFFLEQGQLIRPLGNTIYLMPPYCTSDEDLDTAYQAIAAAADRFC